MVDRTCQPGFNFKRLTRALQPGNMCHVQENTKSQSHHLPDDPCNEDPGREDPGCASTEKPDQRVDSDTERGSGLSSDQQRKIERDKGKQHHARRLFRKRTFEDAKGGGGKTQKWSVLSNLSREVNKGRRNRRSRRVKAATACHLVQPEKSDQQKTVPDRTEGAAGSIPRGPACASNKGRESAKEDARSSARLMPCAAMVDPQAGGRDFI